MKLPAEVDGKNLGEKHKHLNSLVNEAVSTEAYNLAEFDIDDDDIKNLIKIDVANRHKNVDFIMKVLVCSDVLYVSRVMKGCKWLITSPEYSYIINPEYLRNTLYPHMNTKCFYKLNNYIQLNLKDSSRAEQFYLDEENPKKAVKWLLNCSPEFILQNVGKHMGHLKTSQIRRLFEKTIKILEEYVDVNRYMSKSKFFNLAVSMLNSENINNYLNLIENLQRYDYPKFGKSATNTLMRLASERICKKFEIYCNCVHLPTFIKYMPNKNIKNFLLDQALNMCEEKNKSMGVLDKNKLKYFLESMSREDRSNFIQQIFVDKIHKQKSDLLTDSEIKAMTYIYDRVRNTRWFSELHLYQYVSFDVTFTHIKKLLEEKRQNAEINVMFSTLLTTTIQDDKNMKYMLEYFRDCPNVEYEQRYKFMNDLIGRTNFHRFSKNLWNVIEDVMMIDIVGTENEVQKYLEAIIIYKVLHSEVVPDVIDIKFKFTTLSSFKNKINEEEKSHIFNYLQNRIQTQLLTSSMDTEEQFNEIITIIDKYLNLLNDWDRDLKDYQIIISKIKELILVKKEKSWKHNLSFLYNKNKTWKKWLYNYSFILSPCQEVCLNALKHDPTIFQQYQSETEDFCLKEKENVIQFLRKIKVYWSQSLTKFWTDIFINKLNNLDCQMASTKGLCILLPRQELLTFLQGNVPENAKIDYGDIDELTWNLQRCFAKNMHIARPQPPPEVILQYAKGDYLKHSLHSLLSIYHNLSEVQSGKYISEMFSEQVPLQKHAIRLSFIKIKTKEITPVFADVWKTSTSSTIRTVLFKTVYNLLCKEKDPIGIEMLWNLMEMFINHLTFNENNSIYDTLLEVTNVPESVKARYFVKSFLFLKGLCSSDAKYEEYGSRIKYTLFPCARDIIETLPPDFITNILLEFIHDDFLNESAYSYTMQTNLSVLTSYLLTAKNEDSQIKKYEQIFIPILKFCSTSLKNSKGRDHCIINIERLLDNLCEDVQEFYLKRNMILPKKMFSLILEDLIETFSETENYLLLMKWRLTVLFNKSLEGIQGDDWDEICSAAAPIFGKHCYELLSEQSVKHFTRIYILFAKALQQVLAVYIPDCTNASKLKIYECLLLDKNFIQGYLAVLKLYPKYIDSENDEVSERVQRLRTILFQHPSLEVKMHYHNMFTNK